MKSTMITSIILATLLSTISASPTSLRSIKRQEGAPGVSSVCTSSFAPTQETISTAIEQWRSDVVNVNIFLNGFSTSFDLQEGALTALNVAVNEPNQLGVLACVPGLNASSEAVIATGAANFGKDVLQQLQNIAGEDTPFEYATTDPIITAAANTINEFRCCTLLPGLATLWSDAVALRGLLGLDISVPRPNTCASLTS